MTMAISIKQNKITKIDHVIHFAAHNTFIKSYCATVNVCAISTQ